MKVIHIVHGKANPNGHNGISRVVYFLNKYEKLKGCDSQVWAIVDGVKAHFTHKRDAFVTVECFPRVWFPWGRNEIIQKLIEQKNTIDLVHFHLIWAYDKNIIAKALKKAGIPFIITTHGTYTTRHAYTGKRLLAKWLYELDYLKLATELHVVTREEGAGHQRYGYNEKSFVVCNGVALEEIPVKRSNEFFANKPYKNKIKLIWVGVLREDKNLRSLVQAVAMLPESLRERFVCILVGPDYRGNATRYITLSNQLGCQDNFDYIGPLYDQTKYDAMESADVYVMPSFTEGFSMALLDAMACSKPSLVTSGCGVNYFIQHNFFVRCESYPQDIARGLEELFARQAEWKMMGQNARRLIDEQLNWPKIAEVMLDNYKRILKGEC